MNILTDQATAMTTTRAKSDAAPDDKNALCCLFKKIFEKQYPACVTAAAERNRAQATHCVTFVPAETIDEGIECNREIPYSMPWFSRGEPIPPSIATTRPFRNWDEARGSVPESPAREQMITPTTIIAKPITNKASRAGAVNQTPERSRGNKAPTTIDKPSRIDTPRATPSISTAAPYKSAAMPQSNPNRINLTSPADGILDRIAGQDGTLSKTHAQGINIIDRSEKTPQM